MSKPSLNRWVSAVAVSLVLAALANAQMPAERKVAAATRLDWAFAVQGFGAGADKLPATFDSTKQRYQLFVPKQHKAGQGSPLVLFISAGDQPAGWEAWKMVCDKEGVFFASPFAAGNNVAAGQRTRIVLDVLDDIRRAYRIDPDQTYLSGFSGGARMACTIGFALPECVAGVVPICGTNPISGPAYLRHRWQDRGSVAFITGTQDFNRKENEEYMAPWLKELGIRTRLWVVPKLGHGIPSGDILAKAYAWLKDDLKRRRADAKARPDLSAAPDDAAAGAEMVKRLIAAGQADLKQPERTWRGIALLQGAAQRSGNTEPGKTARRLLQEALGDQTLVQRIAEQGAADEQLALSSQARALERFGQTGKAIDAWAILAKNYEGTPTGRSAEEEIRRLTSEKLPRAYLGLGLAETVIDQLAPKGPAAKAGLKVGDVLVKIGDRKIATADDLALAMQTLKPGDRVRIEVRRDAQLVVVMVEVGERPAPEKK